MRAWTKHETAPRTPCPDCHFESSEGYPSSHAPGCGAAGEVYSAEEVEALIDVMWDGTPDCMGATPDLAWPQCRQHDHCPDLWDCWEKAVKERVAAVRRTVRAPSQTSTGVDAPPDERAPEVSAPEVMP